MFVLFGQRAARSQMLPRPANVGSGTDGQVSLPIESHSHSLGSADGNCLPPRVEDYVDRSSVLSEILRNFDSSGGQRPRRACVLSGPEGIGKTVAAIELAHFASSPGRLFSRNVLYVPIDGTPDIANVVQGISQSLATRRPPVLSSASRNQKDILQALHHLDHTRGRHLLLLDDRCGAVGASSEVRSLLSNMLEAAKNLSLVVCSREQMYESLGPCKCVNVPMVALTAVQSAQLFLKRMHRPLRPCDFEQNASTQIALARSEEILTRLAQHPLLVQLAGNPGQVDAICQRVTPQLRSLFDLCGVRAARAMSLDESIASHVSVLVPQEKTIEPLQLTRKMSIDGAVGELLPKAMSMDGPALARAMSIDETQVPPEQLIFLRWPAEQDVHQLVPSGATAPKTAVQRLEQLVPSDGSSATEDSGGICLPSWDRICLLDMDAEDVLQPDDVAKFDAFVFGGILGNVIENDDGSYGSDDRTSEIRSYFKHRRHLGPMQMTTDTAVLVSQKVLERACPLAEIPFLDSPEFQRAAEGEGPAASDSVCMEVWEPAACICARLCVCLCVCVRMCMCMYMCLLVCLCFCLFVCLFVCVFVGLCVCVFGSSICVHFCMYVCMHVCTNVCMYVRMVCLWEMCMCACMYVCMHVCV
ncbi:SFM1 [Symbiodinium sp. CCMP2456]|nr:SFM1 [Symbiodinium sp. CCMP2456]